MEKTIKFAETLTMEQLKERITYEQDSLKEYEAMIIRHRNRLAIFKAELEKR